MLVCWLFLLDLVNLWNLTIVNITLSIYKTFLYLLTPSYCILYYFIYM